MCNLHQDTPEIHGQAEFPHIRPAGAAALKFWEVEHFFRCPVIGMCLTSEERRQLLKKSGFCLKDKSAYAIQEILVKGAESENRLSQKVEALLNRKFGRRVSELARLNEQELMGCWNTAVQRGDYLAEFWAVVNRRDLSVAARRDVFGTIHMSMHANADSSAHFTRRLENLKSRASDQDRKIKELIYTRRELTKENDELKRRLAQANNRLGGLEQAVAHLQRKPLAYKGAHGSLEEENKYLKTIVSEQIGQLQVQAAELRALNKRVNVLSSEMESQKQSEAHFMKETQETLQSFLEMNRCDSGCPSFDLCRKRVLIVGGIARMEALYRELIETSGGFFEYHDGYMNGGAKQLESRLKRSDLVLCPVNCNSHAACAMVKNLGKKHNKPVHMLANFSLNAVSQVIRTCGAGTSCPN